jgi:predicted ATPase/DNA-binding XRE family transcriptional regulator
MRARAEDLGDLLRRMRVRRGLTQEELAALIPEGLSVDTVSNIERGRVRPRRHTLLALLDILEPDDAERSAALDTWRLPPGRVPGGALPSPTLPVPSTPLIGRERDLAALTRLFGASASRMVTLTGAGGVGKTRLALAAAATAEPAFADRAAFADLAALHDPGRFLPALALGLGLSDMGDLPAEERLTAYLRPKHLLLLLDNCEAIVAAGPQLARLIDRCPALTVLATSREAMRIRCEQEYRVAPLELPSADEVADHLALTLVPAVGLFVERTRMVTPDFAVTTGNAAAVAQICRRLDGLPLAIELAAARMRHFSAGALCARLENALSVLVGGPRDLPERQRTLRATLDWSYGLLTATQQKALRRLSVFVDGFTGPAAASICALSPEEPAGADFDDVLAALLDKSLLRTAPHQSTGDADEPRYGLLETIREYGREQLREAGEEPAARDRHARFYREMAEASFGPMYSGVRRPWIEALTAETGNLDAALSWCLGGEGDAETGLRLAGALGRYWYFTGRLNQGRAWLARALDSDPGRRPTPERARALYSAGKLAWAQGDFDAAVQHVEASLALVAESDDVRMRGEALTLAGYTRMAVGRPESALAALEESRRIFEAAGDTWQVALAAVMQSEVRGYMGDHDTVFRHLETALALFVQTGDRWGEAVAHAMTAMSAWRRGDLAAVEHHLSYADATFQEMNEKYGQSRLRLLRAYVRLAHDDRAEARRLFREGLTLARELGQTAYSLLILGGCAAIALLSGKEVEAARLYGRAAPLLEADTPHVDDGAAAARAAYARYLPRLRDCLDRAAFDAAWSDGQSLPIEDALDLALSIVCDPDEVDQLTDRPAMTSRAG